MSVLWAESFEHYGTGSTGYTNMLKGLWSSVTAIGTQGPESTSTARTGTYYYKKATNSSQIRRAVGTRSKLGMAFGIRFPTLPANSGERFYYKDGSNNGLITFVWQTDGSIKIYAGEHTGTLLDTTEQVIVANTWHHVEIIVQMSATVGSIEIRIDNVPVSILADLNLGSTDIAQVQWYSEVAQGATSHLDDIVAHTGVDFIGPARVSTSYLASDVSPFFDWTVTGAASGAEAVDEIVPDDDTTSITAENVNDIAQFVMPTLPADVENVVALYVPVYAKQNEAGVTSIQTSMLSDAEISEGAEHALTPSYAYQDDVFDLDPATGTAWTKASLEAAILQLERTV
jgi:hypothetical protein